MPSIQLSRNNGQMSTPSMQAGSLAAPAPGDYWKAVFVDGQNLLRQIESSTEFISSCSQFGNLVTETLKRGGTVFTCGNGGSHCDAMHFAEELTGRYRKNRRPLAALCLGDASHTTCVANDFGFEWVFSRQIEALGRPGDLLVGISTSGNSANVIRALEQARKKGLKTAALLGKGGGKIRELVDLPVTVPADTTDWIQEVHIKVIHNTIQYCERVLFPENYLP